MHLPAADIKPHAPPDSASTGPLYMLAAALLFTLLTLLIKTMGPAYTVWHIGFYRFLGGIVLIWIVFGRGRNPYKGHNMRLLVLRGCTGSAAFICIVTAIRLLPMSEAMVLFYSFPAFAALFSFWLYGDRIGKWEMACVATILAGVGVLFDFSFGGGQWGQIMALTSGALAGLTVTLIKRLTGRNGPAVIYLYLCTLGLLVTLPKFLLNPIWPTSPRDVLMVLSLIFVSLTGQLLMNQGFAYCKSWEGGAIMSTEIIFTSALGIVFLGDPTTWRFWTGGLMIFASVLALNRIKARRQKTLRGPAGSKALR